MLLRDSEQEWHKLRIPIECPDALKDIPGENLKCFTHGNNLLTLKMRVASEQLLVDDGVELLSC